MTAPAIPVVAIIGGGFVGAATAWHLARATRDGALRIVVIEPREDLGRGLAYSTPDPDHRLNVPEHKMTLDTSDPLHFRRWLTSFDAPFLPAGSATLAGDVFAPRAVFGQYVGHYLRPWLASGRIEHLRAQAVSAQRIAGGYRITLASGGELTADRLVLAVSHPAPGIPAGLAGLKDDPRLIPDAYVPGVLATIQPDERVLVVGSGLTGADVVATLTRQNQHGMVHLLSRHGRRSQPHGPAQSETLTDFAQTPERTARGLLRRIRAALARDAQAGLTWHAAFDRLRTQGPQIWAALPLTERSRLVRHLRGLWDIHRFRIAPQTYETLERQIASGQVTPVAARIKATRVTPTGISVDLHGEGVPASIEVDRIVLATGPAHGSVLAANPVLAALAAEGALRRDPLGLGLLTTVTGQAVDTNDTPQSDLLIAGPLGRAAVGELMGVPEVTASAEATARAVVASLPETARADIAA